MRLIVSLLLLVPFALLRGLVVADLWHWFVVPLGLPAVGLAHALGLSVLLGFATFQFVKDPFEDVTDSKWGQLVARSVALILLYLSVWAYGWIAASFMP